MKDPYGEGLATHTGPESCGVFRKERAEALTGVRAGWVLSRERVDLRGADAVGRGGRQQRAHRYREMRAGLARSKTPSMYGKHFAREPGGPMSAWADGAAGRVGKSKDARRR